MDDEVKEAIILAAGKGGRMDDFTKGLPKCMLTYKNQTLIRRLIIQLRNKGIKKIILVLGYEKEIIIDEIKDIEGIIIRVVINPLFEEDTNIHSMRLALNEVNGPCVVFESDTIMEEDLVQYVIGSDFEGHSVWFTNGKFGENMYGGILNTNNYGEITEIKIVKEYSEEHKNHHKLTGLMRIGPKQINTFRELVEKYANNSIKQYYLIPWIENLEALPCIEGNAQHYAFRTFNQPEEYMDTMGMEFDREKLIEKKIESIEIEKLKHIENFDENRVNSLLKKIKQEGFWKKPVYIEGNHNLVLDGQHRLQAAIRLGLKRIPVQKFDYDEVKVWTLRKEENVEIPLVVKRAKEGNIYPYKTVKHKFPNVEGECNYSLEELRKNDSSKKQRLIVLAAGQAFKLDGAIKLLLKDPKTKKTIIDKYLDYFPDYEVTVVVGYKAAEVMSEYPQLNYIYNEQWRITGNSYSLALALDERPCVVLSSDFLFDQSLANLIKDSPSNSIFLKNSENKGIRTTKCEMGKDNEINSIYVGENQDYNPEVVGIFKVDSASILKKWKMKCLSNKSVFCAINFPLDEKILGINLGKYLFHEINTPLDYLNFIKENGAKSGH